VDVAGEDNFRLLDRKVVYALRATRESARCLPALVRWVGFSQTTVQYDRPVLDDEGPAPGPRKTSRAGLASVLSFSVLPVRLVALLGGAMAGAAAVYAVVALILWPILGASLPANLVMLAIGLTGLVLAALGLVGEYVGRAYEEAKGRPLYILREAVGFESDRQLAVTPAAPALTSRRSEPSTIRLFT
jgi:dolichol-phosphate mannosyltransferase